MKVFNLHNQLIKDYCDYIQSFIHIHDPRIKEKVDQEMKDGFFIERKRACLRDCAVINEKSS